MRSGWFWEGPHTLEVYLGVAAALFALGVFALVARRNVIGMLMGVELILNAASLNFVAFARFSGGGVDGQVFSLFIIVLAAAEAAIALALVVAVFQVHRTSDLDRVDRMAH